MKDCTLTGIIIIILIPEAQLDKGSEYMIYKNENLQFLQQLLSKIKLMNFSIQTQYKFLKISKAVENELEIYEEQRKSLIQSYAEFDDKGQLIVSEEGGIKIKEECLQECVKKINEINSLQITFPDIYFSLDELEPLGLTLGELELLEPFIKD